MNNFFQKFGACYRMVGVIILTVMVLIVFVNACMRYMLNSGFIATEELLRYLFIYMTFIGVVEVAYNRGHISVTILTDALKGRIRTAVYLLGYILMLYATYVLIDGTIMFYEESESSVGQVTGIPFRVIIASIMFGGLGLFVFTLRDLILAARALKSGEEFPPRPVDEDLEAALNKMAADEAAEAATVASASAQTSAAPNADNTDARQTQAENSSKNKEH